ncbi:hypothetical protein JYK22_02010 [Nonomuraea sp. RK-328]|nr:hypothetical protein [Nonomuraea sp. RK-328]
MATLAIAAPAPAAVFAAIWGWIDQKSEATSLLRTILDGVSDKLLGLQGYERHQLITAAHTAVVASSFFEVLAAEARSLRLLDEEREMLIADKWRAEGQSVFDVLYQAPVPIPSATCGFQENLTNVGTWLADLEHRTRSYFHPLQQAKPLPLNRAVRDRALERYRTRYLQLAATVPEFFIWASLNEHAATRNAITGVRADLREAFHSQGAALERIERLLNLGHANREVYERNVAEIVARANRGALSQPVIEMSARHNSALTVPTVMEIYVSPHCRLADYNRSISRPASELWWDNQPSSRHLDLLLIAHLASPAAFRRPMLILGHPGAGKSLLTKVLAARLPPIAYTVVRVPLRRVNADATILEQIQTALDLATNRRVQWWEVAQANPQAIRVVLFDGLDEMLQAASGSRDRRGYLQEIMDFQRAEAQQGLPVAAIVTSRTVVTDRVLIADGTTIIKLEDFDDQQISEWLNRWNRVNEVAAAAGQIRALPLTSVRSHQELVKQPLLLLMLALYAADPAAPPIDALVSTGQLYRLLLNEFARREADKPREPLSEKAVAAAVKEHLWRLTVAAFAMVNRGRQDITDAELGADLIALEERQSEVADVAEIGRDLVGRFFFVHRAEARTGNDDSIRRCYEFLHATFGEYLVAEHIVDLLRTLATMRALSSRPVDDGLLHALLSHQPLSNRRHILTFAAELFNELSDPDHEQVTGLLEELVISVRRRHDTGRYASYQPTSLDRVRHLAAYSLNLVLLRVQMDRDTPVNIAALAEKDDDPELMWRSTVALWTAGLAPEQLDGVTEMLEQREGFLRQPNSAHWGPPFREIGLSRLSGDKRLEGRLRFGIGLHDNAYFVLSSDPWEHNMAAWLIPAMFSHDGAFNAIIQELETDVPFEAVAPIARLIDMLLVLHGHQMNRDHLIQMLDWRLSLGAHLPPSPAVLATTLLNDPNERLVEKVLPLLDADRSPHTAVLLSLAARLPIMDREVIRKFHDADQLPQESPYRMNNSQLGMLYDIIKIFRWPNDPTLPAGLSPREEPPE